MASRQRRVEGECEIQFSISSREIPFNIKASCADRVFESEAFISVIRMRFLPQVIDGQPIETHGAIYPMEFRLNSK